MFPAKLPKQAAGKQNVSTVNGIAIAAPGQYWVGLMDPVEMVWAWRVLIKGMNPNRINMLFPKGKIDLPSFDGGNEAKIIPKALVLKSKGLFMRYRFIKNSVNIKIIDTKVITALVIRFSV